MKVKIIKASKSIYWYYKYINQTIEVEDKTYKQTDGLNYKATSGGYILAQDCEIYKEPKKRQKVYKTINLRRD